jgi:hypothetical protein
MMGFEPTTFCMASESGKRHTSPLAANFPWFGAFEAR